MHGFSLLFPDFSLQYPIGRRRVGRQYGVIPGVDGEQAGGGEGGERRTHAGGK